MTIKRAEGSGNPPVPAETLERIRRLFEANGVQFLEKNGGGPGVRLSSREGEGH